MVNDGASLAAVQSVLAHPRYAGEWIDLWRVAEAASVPAPTARRLLVALERDGRAERETARTGTRWRLQRADAGRNDAMGA